MKFDNRVAVVTGGSSGIGKEVLKYLLAEGVRCTIADLNESGIGATFKELNSPDSLLGIQMDVSNEASVRQMVDETCQHFGKIDILVHCAGIGVEKLFLDTCLEDWQRIIDVDLTGSFITGKAVAAEMKKRGYGRIINFSSTAGVRAGTGRAAYGAAKAGVIAMSNVMAVELAQYGITVNSMAPGAIETEMVAKMHDAETRRAYTDRIPLQRYGTPAEVAAATAFLASDEAGYITGHTLFVDGGFNAGGILKKQQ
ncbi:MAG: SDR family NAD(P)-dependent oxidoreductase [Motiliproteus sp.]